MYIYIMIHHNSLWSTPSFFFAPDVSKTSVAWTGARWTMSWTKPRSRCSWLVGPPVRRSDLRRICVRKTVEPLGIEHGEILWFTMVYCGLFWFTMVKRGTVQPLVIEHPLRVNGGPYAWVTVDNGKKMDYPLVMSNSSLLNMAIDNEFFHEQMVMFHGCVNV